MKGYYAAVDKVEKATGTGSVLCIICLVNFNPRDKEGMIFGYKAMDEIRGACENDCPARIIDPVDSGRFQMGARMARGVPAAPGERSA